MIIKKNEIGDFLSVAEQKSSKLMELAGVTSDEAKTRQDLVGLRKNLASSCLKSMQDRVSLGKTEEKIIEDVQRLKQQIASARISLQVDLFFFFFFFLQFSIKFAKGIQHPVNHKLLCSLSFNSCFVQGTWKSLDDAFLANVFLVDVFLFCARELTLSAN